jgi:ABC-type bacteriocin/lantibiotic exporter with double-glycine peptidase domain
MKIFKPKPKEYHPNSLKAKVAKYTNILWYIIFISFGIVMIMSMSDSFFINRAVYGKILIRVALSSLVGIFVVDTIVWLIKDSDKDPNNPDGELE